LRVKVSNYYHISMKGLTVAPDLSAAADRGIRTTRTGRVAIIEIDRPPVNSLSFDAYDAVKDAFDEVSADPELSVVVLTGAGGRIFCAGHDVKEFVTLTPQSAHDQLPRVCAAFDAVQNCSLPVIAAVNGPAIGAGLALASLSDIRLAATTATFALPEIDVGVLGSASHLMRLVPQGTARLLALTGRRMTAEAGLKVGLVEEIYAPDELMAAAMALAAEIAAKSPPAVRLCKSTMNSLEELSVQAGYQLECEGTATLRAGRDAAEGARAVLGKRDPSYDL
jgi:enoyl-CoA hydratase